MGIVITFVTIAGRVVEDVTKTPVSIAIHKNCIRVVAVELVDERFEPLIEGTKNLIDIVHTPSQRGLTGGSLVRDATERSNSGHHHLS